MRLFAIAALCLVQASTLSAGSCPTLAQPQGLAGEWPQQFELAELERNHSMKLDFAQNPFFDARVRQGSLPPVSDRLPEDPLVVVPYDDCGRYGGTLRGLSIAFEVGSSEFVSWRQVNLVRLSDDLSTIVPNVAKAWTWSEDYREITFDLRRGHKWSDGAPFTSADIVFYVHEIVLNRKIRKDTPEVWLHGGTPVRVESVDPTRVRFRFASPYPGFLHYLATEGSFKVPFAPKHFLTRFHIDYNSAADEEAKREGFEDWSARFRKYWARWKDDLSSTRYGLGVPTLESHILEIEPTTERRLFVANPYYFKVDTSGKQLPYIDRHEERFLRKELVPLEIVQGNVDQKSQTLTLESYQLLKRSEARGGFTLRMAPGGVLAPIQLNQTHKDPVLREIFRDIRFRRALSLAINRDEINVLVFSGLGEPGQALPAGVDFVTDSDRNFMTQHAPEKASDLLDEMGLERGADGRRMRPDGKPLVITWEYSLQFALSPQYPRLVQKYWSSIGVETELVQTTTEQTRRLTLQNDLSINLEWNSLFGPNMISAPEMFVPPYWETYPGVGPPWGPWFRERGAAGEEPPEWVKDMHRVAKEMKSVHPSSERFLELGRELIALHLEHLPTIGVLNSLPNPTVVSNRLRNVTDWTINRYAYARTYPFRPDQWYLAGSSPLP